MDILNLKIPNIEFRFLGFQQKGEHVGKATFEMIDRTERLAKCTILLEEDIIKIFNIKAKCYDGIFWCEVE